MPYYSVSGPCKIRDLKQIPGFANSTLGHVLWRRSDSAADFTLAQAEQIIEQYPAMAIQPVGGELAPSADTIWTEDLAQEHALEDFGNFQAEWYWRETVLAEQGQP